jgi:hypothetical protein
MQINASKARNVFLEASLFLDFSTFNGTQALAHCCAFLSVEILICLNHKSVQAVFKHRDIALEDYFASYIY